MRDNSIKDRLFHVKYEDVVENPQEMAVKLYQFINATSSLDHAFNFLKEHFIDPTVHLGNIITKKALQLSLSQRRIRLETKWRRGQISRKEFEKARLNSSYIPQEENGEQEERERRLHKYYDTYRPADFRHDHWREELSPQVLEDIYRDATCRKVLRLLSYE